MILVFIVYFKEKRDDQMKKKIVEDFNRKSQHKKWTKRKMLNLAISSGLLFTSLAIPVSIAVTSGTISASAAVLDIELLSNVTSNNDSGTSTSNRWTAANQNQPVNFTVSGGALADASAVFSGQKQAVLVVPPELRGNVAAAGSAAINTNVTIDLSKVTFLTAVLNAANDLTNVITQITSGALGNLTGVDIDLTEVNRQLELVNNIENLGAASFTAPETLAADGSYISAPISDGLGLVLAQNVSNILQDLNAAVQALEAKGTSIPSNLVAAAINAALLPVKGTVNVAVSGALPLLAVGGSGVNELVDASLLGTTTVTLPTTVSTPQNLSNNLDARFVGTVVQTDLLDVNLLATADGVSNIYFAAGTTSEVTAPTITGVTGNSTAGYEVKGTADANATVEIRNAGGTVIGTGTADGTGAFTVTVPAGEAGANETLTAVAKNASGTESTPTTFQTPADEATVTAPTITGVTGNSTAGYEVKGTADANATVEIRNAGGTVIGTGTADGTGAFTVTVPAGEAGANETLTAVAKNASGTESTPTTFQTPADEATVTAPTITGVTGNSTAGYEVKGTADANATVEIRNAGGTVIGTGTADGTGAFTVTVPAGEAGANETLTAVAKNASGTESTPTTFQTPADEATVTAPTITGVTGNSTAGYEVKGTADANATVEIRNAGGAVIGTGTADGTGAFTVTIPAGEAGANETLTAVAKNASGTESTPTTFQTPADPNTPVATPIVETVTGSTTKGYEVKGTAEVGTTIEVRDAAGTVLGTATTGTDGKYTVTLDSGTATANQTLSVVAKNASGTESQPATATTPADVTAPTVDNITGNSGSGYEITGTADPNTTIEVRDPSGAVIGTGTSDANGDFTVTLPTGTTNPGDTLTVIGKDNAGNESQPTEVLVPADATVTAPTVTGVTGNSVAGYQVTGTADPNATIEIRDADGNVIATGTADGTGSFAVNLPAGTANANETLTALAKDPAGNTSTPTTFQTPADEVVAPPSVDKVTGNTTQGYQVTGTAELGTTIEVRATDGTVLGTATTGPTGQYTVTLASGKATAKQTVNVVAKNDTGLESQPTTAMTPADVTTPTIGDITGDSTTGYEITGTADPNTTIEVRNPDGTIIGTTTTDDQGNFTVDLPAGAANPGDTLTVVGKDGDGNESQPTEVTVPEDATVAAPTVTTVTGTTATGYQVTGTAEPNVTIEIHNEAGLVIATGTTDGAGAFTITLPTGTATANEALTAIAKDAAGKESNPTAFKTPADPDAPVATPTVDKITGSTTNGYQVVGAAEVGTTVEVRDADGTVLGMATTGTDGKYTVTLEPGKASANETITVVAKNATGKESQPATATTPVDLATPTIDSITGNSSKGYEITGTAEPKTTIDVRDADGTIIAATTANETGQYTVTLPAGVVTPGETITIISKDGAGNESQPATAVIPADVVLAAPTITKVEGNKANGYTVTGTADPNVTVQFYNSSEQLLASGNTTTGGTFSVHIAAGLATEKETLTALTTDTQGNVSPKTTFMTPADITGEPEIKIAAPTVSSVLGTSKAGYLIKGTAEPNRIIQISNRLLRSVIAVGATDAEGNFAIQLTAGQATAQQSLLATATDGAGHYSTATTFMTPADPTNPGGGNGNTGGNNGNTGGNTGNNGATGGNNGNGSNTGSNPNGGSGLGTTGSGLGSLGNGLGTNGSGYHPKLSTISYGTGNHGKTGYLPSTGEKESSAVTTSLFGAFVALLASMGIIKRKRKN
ncbi:TPA: cell wall surface anchor protein [Enterococcus faecalis]|uniref:Cell wall surface anchor family protein n=40 Tax=Enterococcus TaxID=1350 RepID=Q82YW8_ENTFA|nr:Ig-like domain-containing protein [Enterococcus faecalis]AAO82979.1 cell wall surface anchor family protein [Enterococcus faecalis V583]EIB6821007.1 cell wall surface anchor protein [Enterococcus faecalis]EKC6643181.1 cell wall surface anchor protein [Enterococcus faecalis]EKC6734901.1 cell wall surface anchor protein [Enterococcus faecalis]EKC6782481.1 cell wall surface anchor protein [Enterococcus faecalis]